MKKISLPNGRSTEKLKNNHSILWNDATLYEDFQIISFLVDNIVMGDIRHKSNCVEKIFLNIQKKSWQNQYPVRTFIFLIYYTFLIKITDIKTMLNCQTLEIIYYLKIGTQNKENFGDKVIELYKDIYGLDFQEGTANIIRIIRNNVAHTGTIDGISNKQKTYDKRAINDFLVSSKLKNIRLIAFSFNLLVNDIVIRILGLDINDLNRNLLQPFNNEHFKK